MSKREVFTRVLDIVSEVTDTPSEEILSKSRKEDIIDARYLLVYLLYENGVYPYHIANYIGCSTRNINKVIGDFLSRKSSRKYLRINYEQCKKNLG